MTQVKGWQVRRIQLLLAFLGYYTHTIDGIDGKLTRQALTAFQRDHDLDADGCFGPESAAALLQAVSQWKPGDFWDGIRWFSREEFRCTCKGKHCGGFPAEPEQLLVTLADQVREHFEAPVTVSSGVRCPARNSQVGGVSNSRHLLGKAMDFSVRNVPASRVLAYVRTLPGVRYAYAIDANFVHMDIA